MICGNAKSAVQALKACFVAVGGLVFSLAPATAETVRVAVATNFKSTLEKLSPPFEEATGHKVVISAGSTGKHYAQIINHAPFDVFLAADQRRPILLEEAGLAVPNTRFTYAVGQLVLISADGHLTSEDSLARDNLRHVAVANPELAPYGAAATDVIEHLGLTDALASKLVLGENVGQVFAFVVTGNAELGLVALSQVMARPGDMQTQYWQPPLSTHRAIQQDAILLGRAQSNQAACEFMRYLRSDPAKEVISKSGYQVP